MKPEKVRISDKQRELLKIEDPSVGDICTVGHTKCIDGNVYICQIGDDQKPDWFFTNELCENLRSQTFGNMVITEKSDITISSAPVEVTVEISGKIGESSPKVFTKAMPSTIQAIAGLKLSIAGVAKFTGIGTNVLIVEIWASGIGGNPYSGKASCTLVLK